MTTAGFVGLGHIGAPMARRVAERFETVVFDLLDAAMADLCEAGAEVATDCAALATRCRVIGVCVVDDVGTRAVVAGDRGLLAGAKPGTVIALHGTIHPETARELAAAATASGVELIDAQVTGGPAGAASGTLTSMVGGSAAALEQARGYLESFSRQITHCGPVGAGSVAKLCNNLVQYQTWRAFVEAQRLANASGIEDDALWEVLSWTLNDNARAMLAGRRALVNDPGNAVIRPAFERALALAEKDLHLALDVGRRTSVPLPATALCSQAMRAVYGLEPSSDD